MKTVEFEAQFGNETKKVKLVCNTGGCDGWQVLINSFYQGQIFYKDGIWQAHLNAKTILTGDDITILGEIIEKRSGISFPLPLLDNKNSKLLLME
jgi:hypothetical protein